MKETNVTRISIGTSGWTYDGWRGSLYPNGLRKSNWLPFYASRFRTVEINGSFYRTPSLEAVQAWHDHTPKNFHFAWKASKFITHWKRLSDKCENSIALMDSRLSALEQKISVVLFQLPPNFLEDAERLGSFLAMLPRCYRYAFEFRHRSWYVDRVLTILREAATRKAVWCGAVVQTMGFHVGQKKSPAGGDGASLPPRPATGAGGLKSDRQTANATSRRGVHSSAITCALSTEYSGSLAMLAVTRLAWSLVMRTCTTALYPVEPRRRRRSCGSFHRGDLDAAPTIAAKRAASFGAAA